MRYLLLALFLFGFTSCHLFESKEEKTQKLVQKELIQIDWSDVDDYPLFEDCDETLNKKLQRDCFENNIIENLSRDLKEFQFISESRVEDVVFLDFKIESDGTVAVVNVENIEILGEQKAEFIAKVQFSLNSLPHIEPALKRGIPVSAKFRVPIFLNSK